jgi:UDP-N-acetylmuramoyl-tripeptide--D-alanyl-D-alanine ligase
MPFSCYWPEKLVDWTWTEEIVVNALGGPSPARLPQISITSVHCKPDECSPGVLFVPLPIALKRQGFEREEEAIAAAIESGASMALTNLWQLPFRPRVPVMRAAPTIAALIKLAQFARSGYRGKVVAVTGSVGKTTTTALVHHMLSHAGLSFKSPGNTIEAVCEVAINRPIKSHFTITEIESTRPGHLRHAGIARPHVGIVTNVGLSHLANYRRAEDILREKVSLFDHLEGERVGIIHRSVLDADRASEGLIRSKGLSRLITVGKESNNDIHLTDMTFDGTASAGTMSVLGRLYRFRLSLPGQHFVDNAMFAVAVGSALSLDIDPLIASFTTAMPSSRRFERHRIATKAGVIELIDDSYNAAPDSVSALLDTLGKRVVRRKVFIFGDMLELGNHSAQLHEAIAPIVKRAGVDLLVTVGAFAHLAGSQGASNEIASFANADAASAALPSLIESWDLVAVKASNAIGLETVVSAIRAMGESTPAMAWRIEDEWSVGADEWSVGADAASRSGS